MSLRKMLHQMLAKNTCRRLSRVTNGEIGQDGVIAYAEINPDCTQRPDPEDLLPVLQALAEQNVSAH